jgi:preprotein translocase subunit SecA
MENPQPAIWGPELWTILHSAAERIGSKSLNRLPLEEMRLWSTLLSSLRFTLPCPQCKKHFADYYSTHPIPRLDKKIMREWLYHLHQQVNIQQNKDTSFTLEHAEEHYSKPFHFSRHMRIVRNQMMAAIKLKWVEHADMQRTLRTLEEFRRFYDFF